MTLAGVQLRLASPADREAILALERATANAPHWPPATYSAILEAQSGSPAQSIPAGLPTPPARRCLFVAGTDAPGPHASLAAISGFVVAHRHPSEPLAEIESIAVAAPARRRGIGRTLCLAAIAWCREQHAASISLEVRAASVPAIALYTGLGFTPAGRRPRYYRDPEDDALILTLTL